MFMNHRYLKNLDYSSFVMCPLLALSHPRLFLASFIAVPQTVLMRQTQQAVCAINQSIFLMCLCYEPISKCTVYYVA